MTSGYFTYEKNKVIQALRYHFISRKEIKILMVLVNVFAIITAALFFFKKISPLAFLISSMMWFTLMVLFWFLLPWMVYRKAQTFKDHFRVSLDDHEFKLENERGQRSWGWNEFSTWMESPHFYHLYFNARSFFIIPKEAFEADDVHIARRIFKEKINKL